MQARVKLGVAIVCVAFSAPLAAVEPAPLKNQSQYQSTTGSEASGAAAQVEMYFNPKELTIHKTNPAAAKDTEANPGGRIPRPTPPPVVPLDRPVTRAQPLPVIKPDAPRVPPRPVPAWPSKIETGTLKQGGR